MIKRRAVSVLACLGLACGLITAAPAHRAEAADSSAAASPAASATQANATQDIPPYPKSDDQSSLAVTPFLNGSTGLKALRSTGKLFLVPLYSDATDHVPAAKFAQFTASAGKATTYWAAATKGKVNLTATV